MRIGERIRRFYNTWLAPGYGVGVDNPRPAVFGTILLLVFDWPLFYVLIPYGTISNKELFWIGFFAWLLPPAVTAWVVRNRMRVSANRAYGVLFAGLGFTIILVYSLSLQNNAWDPILFASWPGALNGAGVGIDSTLLWKSWKDRI